MASWAVTKASERPLQPVEADGICQGVAQAILAGPAEGALHLEVALVELAPGGTIEGHLHPFEESFYILEGEVLVTLADRSYHLVAHDWGYAPVSTPPRLAEPRHAAGALAPHSIAPSRDAWAGRSGAIPSRPSPRRRTGARWRYGIAAVASSGTSTTAFSLAPVPSR
ncbi:MAG: hypothetical protein KatS3mg065_0948 [Chloroflexota bacterium]|nr:MAG: hypothetical protein KatS3mg065_0948 [Chloroflexota bacterium]